MTLLEETDSSHEATLSLPTEIRQTAALENLSRPRSSLVLGIGLLATLFTVAHILIGTTDLPITQVLVELAHGIKPISYENASVNSIVWSIRVPRALECLLVGGLLGSVGSVFQALFRNPLADPYTSGVASGAALGGAAILILPFSWTFGVVGMAFGGCVTGILTLLLVYRISLRRGLLDVRTLLLAGVLIGSLFSSFLSLMILLSGRTERDVLHWLLGDTSSADWPRVSLQVVALVIGFGILYRQSRKLNAFAIGEDTARRLGVDVRSLTKVILLTGGIMTAVAVGTVGVIGFLGLIAPHIARKLVGVDWRWSLPASLGMGALLLVASDLVASRFFSLVTHTPGMDLPVGIVTSLLGAPFLLILIKKS